MNLNHAFFPVFIESLFDPLSCTPTSIGETLFVCSNIVFTRKHSSRMPTSHFCCLMGVGVGWGGGGAKPHSRILYSCRYPTPIQIPYPRIPYLPDTLPHPVNIYCNTLLTPGCVPRCSPRWRKRRWCQMSEASPLLLCSSVKESIYFRKFLNVLNAHTHREKLEAKAKVSFDVCRMFFDIFCLSFDLFHFHPHFHLV